MSVRARSVVRAVFVACGLAASTACGSPGPSAPPVDLSGDYVPTVPGLIDEVTFSDATHYSMVRIAGTEEGTYAVSEEGDSIAFTDDATGATISIPFQAPEPSDPATATSASSPSGGTSLLSDAVSLEGVSLYSGSQALVTDESEKLLSGFTLALQAFKRSTPKIITCGEPNCSLSKWEDRHHQTLAPDSHYYDELGTDLGVMSSNPLVNVGMRHNVKVGGQTQTMVYAFGGSNSGWVKESLFNHGKGVSMDTYEDPSRPVVHDYHFKSSAKNASDNAGYVHKCINPAGCNGRGDNTLSDYMPETKEGFDVINLPEGVPDPTNPSKPTVYGSVVSATTVVVTNPNAVFHASSVTVKGALWDYDSGSPKLSSDTAEWVYGEVDKRWCWTLRMSLE
jgi:hypothetical protein